VHLYEERGLDFVDELRGMFAIALYDRERETLVLVRDRVGKKPLYYAERNGVLVFASEVKAIHASRLVEKVFEPRGLGSYLTQGFVVGEGTLFRDVRKLPAGCLLTASRSGVRVARYWDLPTASPRPPAFDDAAATVREMLDEAVRVRLMSEVPLGAFLSGGVDSSAVVAL